MSEPETAPDDLADPEGNDENFLQHGQAGQFHVPFSDMKDIRNGLLSGLFVGAVTQTDPLDVGVGAFAAALAKVRKLEPDEVVALHVMQTLAGGGSMYKVPIDEGRLVAALKNEEIEGVQLDEAAARRLLFRMKDKRILSEGADQWLVVW